MTAVTATPHNTVRLAPAPALARIEAKLNAIMLERGLALTPCETPIPMVPEEVR